MERTASLPDAVLAYDVTGSGPRFVWVHGLASCRDGDRDVIDAFSRHFTVLSYDARGHGRSGPKHHEADFTYPLLARDLIQLIDHVGWDRAIFAGSSMGAATAARVAIERPECVEALIALRPGSDGGPAPDHLRMLFRLGAAAIRSGGFDGAIEFLKTIPQARDALEREPDRIDRLIADWSRHDPLSIAAALEGIPNSTPFDGDVSPDAIVAPALVIPGNDLIHSTANGRAVAKLIPTARVIDPLDAPSRETEVEMLVGVVLGFLSGR